MKLFKIKEEIKSYQWIYFKALNEIKAMEIIERGIGLDYEKIRFDSNECSIDIHSLQEVIILKEEEKENKK